MNSVKILKNGLYGRFIPSNNISVGKTYTSSSSTTNYNFNLFLILNRISDIKVFDDNRDISRMHLSMLKYLIKKKEKITSKYYNKEHILFRYILYVLFNIHKKIRKLDKEINTHKHVIINDLKKFDKVEIKYEHPLEYFNNIKVRLKKGVLHSLEEPSVEICTDLSQYHVHIFYLNGKEYSMNEWLNHPYRLGELRKKKLNKILN